MFAIPLQFNWARSFSEGLACAGSINKHGFIDTSGNFVIPKQYKLYQVQERFSHGLAAFKVKQQWGLLDKTGTVILSPCYERIGKFYDGFAQVKVKSKPLTCGFIDTSGNLVILPRFQRVGDFWEGIAPARYESGRWGYIDKAGNPIVEPQFTDAQEFREGLARVAKEGHTHFINPQGDIVFTTPYNPSLWFKNGFIRAHRENYSPMGDKKVPPCGFLDQHGQVAIPFEYANGQDFSEQLAAVQIDEKWAFIDANNQLVIAPRFQATYGFAEGLAVVQEHNRWGYIDRQGHYVIAPQFDWAMSFSQGLACVAVGKKYGYLQHPFAENGSNVDLV